MVSRYAQLAILIGVLGIPAVSQNAPAARESKDQKLGTANPSNSSQPSTDNGGANAAVQPNEQDADHQSNAVRMNDEHDRAMSESQSGIPAPSVSAQAEAKLARERSSDHDSWSSTSALVWGLLAFSALVVLAVLLWQSGRRFARTYHSEMSIEDDNLRRVA
jgi:cobalamin biosynthesis Mg chelatase CobN